MKKVLNLILLSLLVFYTSFLVFRVVAERLGREPQIFLFFYVSIGILVVIVPPLLRSFLVLKNKLKPKTITQKKRSRVLILIENLKEEILKKMLELKNFFIFEFFLKFLYDQRKIRIMLFYVVNFIEKLLRLKKTIYLFLLILPNLAFVGCVIYEVYYSISGKIYFSLYVLSITTLLNFVFNILLNITVNLTLGISKRTLLIYFPQIVITTKYLLFFLHENQFKEAFFKQKRFQTKKNLLFLWNLFSKHNTFFTLKLKAENFKIRFSQIQKLTRKINLVILSLVFWHLIEIPKLWLVSLLVFFVVILEFSLIIQDEKYEYNRKYPHVSENYFFHQKEILKKEFDFFSETDFLVCTKTSATKMVNEELELLELIDKQSSFSKLSSYELNQEETMILERIENDLIGWFNQLEQDNLIDETSYTIKNKKK